MSATFKVNEPAEFTIQIGLTVHNDTVTVQQQHVQKKMHQAQPGKQLNVSAKPEHQQQQSVENLLRNLNSLSLNSELVESAEPHRQLLTGISELEPPAQLSQTKRRERAAQRPRPVGIPNVPDSDGDDGLDSSGQQPRGRRNRRAGASAAAATVVQSSSCAAWKHRVERPPELLMKIADQAVPAGAGGGTAKLMRPLEVTAEQAIELNSAVLDDIYRGHGDDVDQRRRRQPSSVTLPPDSPYAPSGASSHASSSPPASWRLAPTPPTAEVAATTAAATACQPPQRRRRGRPPKVRVEGGDGAGRPTVQATPAAVAAPPLQPRPSRSNSGGSISGWGGRGSSVVDFVSASDLAEADRVIGRYTDKELWTPNDQGDLMSHRLAKEGNWPKVMALIRRWLSSSCLGDIAININTPNEFGHTIVVQAVVQQNLKAVEYCCLFTSSCDGNLFQALVEAALLPSDAIFYAVLRTMCHELDENGNAVKRQNSSIDRPIGGWRFVSAQLTEYAGLTLAQALTLQRAPCTHKRLAALIGCGASPTQSIGPDASEFYRCYMDCVGLAAAFSPTPYECLMALGMAPDAPRPFAWDSAGEVIKYCVRTICERKELSENYRQFVEQKLSRSATLPQLDPDDIQSFFECVCY